jgi:hypothetical protein
VGLRVGRGRLLRLKISPFDKLSILLMRSFNPKIITLLKSDGIRPELQVITHALSGARAAIRYEDKWDRVIVTSYRFGATEICDIGVSNGATQPEWFSM